MYIGAFDAAAVGIDPACNVGFFTPERMSGLAWAYAWPCGFAPEYCTEYCEGFADRSMSISPVAEILCEGVRGRVVVDLDIVVAGMEAEMELGMLPINKFVAA